MNNQAQNKLNAFFFFKELLDAMFVRDTVIEEAEIPISPLIMKNCPNYCYSNYNSVHSASQLFVQNSRSIFLQKPRSSLFMKIQALGLFLTG